MSQAIHFHEVKTGTSRLWECKACLAWIYKRFTRSQAPALIVIHKYSKPVILAWMPTNQPGADLDARSAGRSPNHRDVVSQSSVQGRQTLIYYIAQMKHLSKLQVTVHGLDTGIPAGMTAFLARQVVYNDESSRWGMRSWQLCFHRHDQSCSPDEAALQRNPGCAA